MEGGVDGEGHAIDWALSRGPTLTCPLTCCIAGLGPQPRPSYASPAGRPWRVEVRGCLLHKARILNLLPLTHGTSSSQQLTSPPQWYRALDARITASTADQRLESWRYVALAAPALDAAAQQPPGCLPCQQSAACGPQTPPPPPSASSSVSGTFFLHPPNDTVKVDSRLWSAVASVLRSGHQPPLQQGGKVGGGGHRPGEGRVGAGVIKDWRA